MVKIYYAISLYFISYSSRIYSGIYLHVRGHSVVATLNMQSTGTVQKGGTLGRSSSTAKGDGYAFIVSWRGSPMFKIAIRAWAARLVACSLIPFSPWFAWVTLEKVFVRLDAAVKRNHECMIFVWIMYCVLLRRGSLGGWAFLGATAAVSSHRLM